MAKRDLQAETLKSAGLTPAEGRPMIERLLKILAWEIGILLFLMAYLAFARPQPGRFQFVALRSGEVVLYDTATGRAFYQKPEVVPTTEQPPEGEAHPPEGEP